MVIESIWVFAVFGCLAVLALVASRVVRRREAKRRHEEAAALTRRPQRPWIEGDLGDRATDEVPSQRENVEQRHEQPSKPGGDS